MGTKYSQQSATGYNASPPTDDGSQSENNKTKWQDHVIEKVGNPLKTLATDIDSALRAHFDEGPDEKSISYTTLASDFGKIIEVSSGAGITLGDPAVLGAGYRVTVKNVDTSALVVDVDNTGTIDGGASITLGQYEYGTFMVNNGAGEYIEIGALRDRPGAIKAYGGTSEPGGWLFCNGQEVSRTTYAALFTAIGTAFGTGDGSTTFALPDLRDRAPLGTGTIGTTDAARVGNYTTALGDSGGEDTITLTTSTMPEHEHYVINTDEFTAQGGEFSDDNPADNDKHIVESRTQSSDSRNYSLFGSNTTPTKAPTETVGGGNAHDNMPPFLSVNWLIKI